MIEINQPGTTRTILLAALIVLPFQAPAQEAGAADADIEEIVVTSQRREQRRQDHAGNIALLGADEIAAVAHQHIYELMTRAPGVWLSRGSGQEHLTAIRSPVLTGPGSCGSFLFLEDGIPIRPAGFCNVNEMFEMHTEQAASIEVIRGPGTALYGSNALHGIINVLTPTADPLHTNMVALEAGSNDFLRVRASLLSGSDEPWLASIIYANDDGFRDDSGYRQGKLLLKRNWVLPTSDLVTAFAATDLDQDTAGFIFGEDAYKDPDLNRTNPNPEAFRDASSQRLYAIWNKSASGYDLDVRPYLRHSRMRFLQHFLPGQPLEKNGHVSAGAMTALTFDREDRHVVVGIDLEWSDIYLEETQLGPTEGSPFLEETRPEGKHYDYDVVSVAAAPYLHADFELGDRLVLGAGLRLEYLHYDYDNNMLTGNTRDDGTPCGFGGCLYTRPASRSDDFGNVAPKFSFVYKLRDRVSLFGGLARGFRAPQATELYRLQSGQQVADLDSERLDSIEFGIRNRANRWSSDVSLFYMKKRDSVFRDAEGFNVSGGRSKHTGLEFDFTWQLLEPLRLEVDASYARHEYDFDTVAARGETFESGNDVDTAPRWLGSAELFFEPGNSARFALQWTMIDDYYLEAENRFTYPGHDLVNLRASIDLSRTFVVTARFNNLFDTEYADRADYAFGQYRYLPGRGRELFIELRYFPGAP